MTYLHAHPGDLKAFIVACAVAAVAIFTWMCVRYRRSNHGTHRAPSHRADPFAGIELDDYEWRDEPEPAVVRQSMTMTGPMPKLTGDTYDLPGWEPLRPLPVQTVNLPPWDVPAAIPVDRRLAILVDKISPEREFPLVTAVEEPDKPLAILTDLPDLVSDPEMDRPRRGPGDGSQVRQPDLPGAAADVMVGDHRAGEAVRRRCTWTSLFGTPDPMPDPQTLAVPVTAGDTDRDGEPSVIDGVVVSHVLADTWLQDQLADLRAWSDSHCQQLADWSHGHELEGAAA